MSSHPQPHGAIPTGLSSSFLNVHEVAKLDKVHRSRMVPSVEWWVCHRFLSKTMYSFLIHCKILAMVISSHSKVLVNILDPVWIGMSQPYYGDLVVEETVNDIFSSEVWAHGLLSADPSDCDLVY